MNDDKTSPTVKLKSAKVFDVAGRAGQLEHMTQIGAEWNGMIELQDLGGNALILRRKNGPMAHAMGEILSGGETEWAVVSASPDLFDALGLGQDPAAPADDRDLRSTLASNLLCWHRLTAEEIDDLLSFFRSISK